MPYDKNELQRKMDGAIEREQSTQVFALAALANLLDPVVVDVHSSKMPLNQVGTVVCLSLGCCLFRSGCIKCKRR